MGFLKFENHEPRFRYFSFLPSFLWFSLFFSHPGLYSHSQRTKIVPKKRKKRKMVLEGKREERDAGDKGGPRVRDLSEIQTRKKTSAISGKERKYWQI